MSALYGNLIYVNKALPTITPLEQIGVLLYFAPLIFQWIDRTKDQRKSLRKKHARKFLCCIRDMYKWDKLQSPFGQLEPLVILDKRLRGII